MTFICSGVLIHHGICIFTLVKDLTSSTTENKQICNEWKLSAF